MSEVRNREILELILKRKLKRWEVADLLGVSEMTVYRKLRHELSPVEKERWIKAIEEGR